MRWKAAEEGDACAVARRRSSFPHHNGYSNVSCFLVSKACGRLLIIENPLKSESVSNRAHVVHSVSARHVLSVDETKGSTLFRLWSGPLKSEIEGVGTSKHGQACVANSSYTGLLKVDPAPSSRRTVLALGKKSARQQRWARDGRCTQGACFYRNRTLYKTD